ncbi:hypothetical protein EJB05_33425, partial [Eragrostis curvula]
MTDYEPEFFPTEIKNTEKRIKDLNEKKRKHEMMMMMATKAGPEETSEPAEEEDTRKKHAKEIRSLERRIRWLEKKKKCLALAIENSIDLMTAQNLVEQQMEEEAAALKNKAEETMREQQQPAGDTNHKDPETVSAVVVPEDKRKLLRVADAVVNVSYDRKNNPDLNDLNQYMTGIIIAWDVTNKRARILTCNCFEYTESGHKIYVRWQYMEDTVFESELLFISSHYMVAVLEITFSEMPVDLPSEVIPSFGLIPKYGQDVFALARDKDLSLMVRHGTILCQQERIEELCQGYLFADYELPECGSGGPVVDHNGNVVGMSFSFEEQGTSVILPISTALLCVEMWTKFRRVTRPLLGIYFKNVELINEISGDSTFDGLVVDQVDPDSTAWELGIRSGTVIVSINIQCPLPLPELEDFLLSCGLEHLHGTHMKIDFELEVHDLLQDVKRSITLHAPFSDVSKDFTDD